MVEITHFDKESVSLQISHIILTAFPDIASLSWSVKSNLFIPLQSRAKGQLEALDSGFSDGRAEGKHHQRIHSTTPRWFSSHTTHFIKLLFCPNLLPELKLKGSKTYKLYLARFFFFCKCCHYQISEWESASIGIRADRQLGQTGEQLKWKWKQRDSTLILTMHCCSRQTVLLIRRCIGDLNPSNAMRAEVSRKREREQVDDSSTDTSTSIACSALIWNTSTSASRFFTFPSPQ